ncbi:hypothetical protein PybrP1_005695 [[Pythium] brassicae (nom. inval.)]|nr:hypothetical protein PybrP1_005695 [[Pythium] brassicae (nom. inval.)]
MGQDDTLLPVRARVADAPRRVSRELLAFATRSFGPRGRATLLQLNARCADALVLTTTAGRLFQHVNVGDCPVANAYFQMLRSHARSHSDAGLLLTILAASLQLEIQDGALAGISRHALLRGLQLARQWSLGYLDDDDCPVRIPVDWSHQPSIYAVVRGVVSPKAAAVGLCEEVLSEHVIPMVVETFVAVYAFVAQNPSEPLPVRFLFRPGHWFGNTPQLWKHSVFLDLPWPRGVPVQPVTRAKLALFNITIDPVDHETSDSVSVEHFQSREPFRLDALRRVGDALLRLGVTAVMSQKIIPRYLQLYLVAKGVFVLDRLSLNHIHAVQQLSGANTLGDWSLVGVEPAAFGFLSLITTHDVDGKRYIRLHREPANGDASASALRSSPVCTIVLEAPDKFAFEELSYSVETALRRLAALAERPDAVAGAGCTEIHLAAFLHQKAALLRLAPPAAATTAASATTTRATQDSRAVRQLRQVVEAFAACVVKVVAYLDPSFDDAHSEGEGDTLFEKLQTSNSHSIAWRAPAPPSLGKATGERRRVQLFGWDPVTQRVLPVAEYTLSSEPHDGDAPVEKRVAHAYVLDSYAAKRDALVLALDCACSIASIASVVRVS